MSPLDSASIRRGLTSLRWFLSAHADELSPELVFGLQGWKESSSGAEGTLSSSIVNLPPREIAELCAAIEAVHRNYFGTMNGRELSAFLRNLASEQHSVS